MISESVDPRFLRGLVAQSRLEAMWLKLVISKLPRLAGFYFLFEDFAPKEGVLLPRHEDFERRFLDGPGRGGEDPWCVDSINVVCRPDGNAYGTICLAYGEHFLQWSAVPPGDRDEPDALPDEVEGAFDY